MKKTVLLFALAALLLCGCAIGTPIDPAPGQDVPTHGPAGTPDDGAAATPAPVDPAALYHDLSDMQPYACDLDGDGSAETVQVTMTGPDAGMEEPTALLQVTNAAGSTVYGQSILPQLSSAFVCGLDPSDPALQIVVCGDLFSEDYATLVWRYRDGALVALANEATQMDYGYDGYTTFDEATGLLRVERYVDVLGTWPAWQHLGLNEAGSALRPQDTLWHSVAGDTPEEYHILTVIAPLPVTLQDGTQTTLAVDTRLWATATDEKSVVHFATADGRRGTIAVTHDDQAWYWCIDGKNEQDYFSPLPYAG